MCIGFTQNNTGGSGGMGRRNTYVCSDRNNTDRLSVVPNGKENRYSLNGHRHCSLADLNLTFIL